MGRKRLGSLDIQEDVEFYERSWRVARFTLGVLLALMLATAVGAFGGGPLSHARAGGPEKPFRVEYERLVRFGASTRLRVHVRPGDQSTAAFTLNREFLDAFLISHVTPAPAGTRLVRGGVTYLFGAEPGTVAEILVELQPARRGLIRGEIASESSRLRLTQFVFP
jgi:hypothetical protein